MKLRTLTLLLTLSVMAASSKGLDSDRYQPIRIQADAAMVDESRGTSIYRGNVIIHQGTLQVTADEVEIYTADNQVIQIIAKAAKAPGELAHYKQQTNDANDMVSAEARKITYLVQEERLHLAGNAKLQQVGDIFTGELLYYDLGRGIVNLDSGGSKGRVNMTILPKQPTN
tara:strand:+ start:203 stop:715 length:513 start_codon:yes stop_codon:yes gene_type:complete